MNEKILEIDGIYEHPPVIDILLQNIQGDAIIQQTNMRLRLHSYAFIRCTNLASTNQNISSRENLWLIL